jgi:hypothetical protein
VDLHHLDDLCQGVRARELIDGLEGLAYRVVWFLIALEPDGQWPAVDSRIQCSTGEMVAWLRVRVIKIMDVGRFMWGTALTCTSSLMSGVEILTQTSPALVA